MKFVDLSVAAEYCTRLCVAYNISVDKIVSHYEAYKLGCGCNHEDPDYWMENFGENMYNIYLKNETYKTVRLTVN